MLSQLMISSAQRAMSYELNHVCCAWSVFKNNKNKEEFKNNEDSVWMDLL